MSLSKSDKQQIKEFKLILKQLSLGKKKKPSKSKSNKTATEIKKEKSDRVKFLSGAYKALAKESGETFADVKTAYKGTSEKELRKELKDLKIKPIYEKYSKKKKESK
jgi:hypothetical protein